MNEYLEFYVWAELDLPVKIAVALKNQPNNNKKHTSQKPHTWLLRVQSGDTKIGFKGAVGNLNGLLALSRKENLFSEVTSEDGRYCYMVLILTMASFVL